MRALIIGGRGHIGQQAVRGLKNLKSFQEVLIGSRAEADGAVVIDLRQPATFEAMRGFDLVINCADTITAPPDEAIRFCLAEGLTFIETASEPTTIRRLLGALRPPSAETQPHRGLVMLGAGIFTGLSNLLAAEVIRRGGERTHSLDLGVRWSPLSAGGGGMVNLVGHLLDVPTLRYEGASAIEGPPVERGPALPFSEKADTLTLHIPFSEATMLRHSTRVTKIAMYGALRPGFLRVVFLLLPLWLMQTRLMKAWLWLQFTVLRRLLLRWYHSSVDLVAVARDAQGQPLSIGRIHADQGMALAGGAIAAQAEYLLAHKPAPGLYVADECMPVTEVFDRAHKITPAPSALSFESRTQPP